MSAKRNPQGSDIMKWVLMAGAAYLVYKYLESAGYLGATTTVASAPATSTSIPVATSTAATVPATYVAPAAAAPAVVDTSALKAQMKALVDIDTTGSFAADGVTRTHSFYTYQWYYRQLTGRDLPPSEDLGLDTAGRDVNMTLDDFWVLLTQAQLAGKTAGYPGLSGFNGLSALYRLASAWN